MSTTSNRLPDLRSGIRAGSWNALSLRRPTAGVLSSASARLASHKARLGAIAGAVIALLLASAVAPAPAYGFCTSVGDCVDGAMQSIFGIEGDWLSGSFVQWLIKIESPGLTWEDGVGAALYGTTRDFAFAALFAVLTLSVIHYWAAGVALQGAGSGIALEGLFRTGGAALFILAWPWIIDSSVELAGIVKDELIPGAKLDGINAALAAAAAANWTIVGIILVSTYALLGLILYVTKVMLSAGLLVIAGGMPLALAVWPIPGLSVFASGMLKWCAGIAAVEIAWGVEVFAYAQIGGEDWLTFAGEGSFFEKLGAPITMVALLALMVMTPSSVLRLVGLGGGGNFVAFLAARFASRGISSKLPEPFGTKNGGGSPPPPKQPLPAKSRAAASNSGGSASSGGSGGSGGSAGSAGAGASTGAAPAPALAGAGGSSGKTPSPGSSPASSSPADGLPRGSSKRGIADAYNEVVGKRTNGVDANGAPASSPASGRRLDAADVRQALSTLDSAGLGQPAAAQIYQKPSPRSDRGLAHRFAVSAADRGLSGPVRGAFTTLGGAEHEVRRTGAKTWTPPAPAAPAPPSSPGSPVPPPSSPSSAPPTPPPPPAPPPTSTTSI